MIFQAEQSCELLIEIFLAIEPAVNRNPGRRREIDQPQVGPPDKFVQRPISFGQQIAQFDLNLIRRDTGETVTYSPGRAIVAFAETGSQNQYSLLHRSLGGTGCDQGQKQIRSHM